MSPPRGLAIKLSSIPGTAKKTLGAIRLGSNVHANSIFAKAGMQFGAERAESLLVFPVTAETDNHRVRGGSS